MKLCFKYVLNRFFFAFLSLGWNLEEIHVTWAQFRKKRDKIATLHEEGLKNVLQTVETVSGFLVTPPGLQSDRVRTFSDGVRIIATRSILGATASEYCSPIHEPGTSSAALDSTSLIHGAGTSSVVPDNTSSANDFYESQTIDYAEATDVLRFEYEMEQHGRHEKKFLKKEEKVQRKDKEIADLKSRFKTYKNI
ncbi:hypothetical protein Tco_0778300 [Tanacetum coccineum]